MKWTDLQNRNIFLEKKHGYQGGTEGIVREFRMVMYTHVHTAIFKVCNQQGPTV